MSESGLKKHTHYIFTIIRNDHCDGIGEFVLVCGQHQRVKRTHKVSSV